MKMTAVILHLPALRIRRPRPNIPCQVICLHHRFKRVETYPGASGLWLWACQGCGRQLSWARETGWVDGVDLAEEDFDDVTIKDC